MKINPLEWSPCNEKLEVSSGVLQLRSLAPFGVLVVVQGVETAIGLQTEARITLPEAATVFLTPAKGATVYRKDVPSRVVHMTEENWTNIDRLPQESGTMLEITKALRMMKIEERAMVRRIRDERALSESVIEESKARRKADLDSEAEALAALAEAEQAKAAEASK